MPPTAPPAAAPTPDWLPSSVTLRTESTVAMRTVCSRPASCLLYTLPDSCVMQPASAAASAMVNNRFVISSSFPRGIAEGAPKTCLDLLARRCVVLRTALRDFDRSHQCP